GRWIKEGRPQGQDPTVGLGEDTAISRPSGELVAEASEDADDQLLSSQLVPNQHDKDVQIAALRHQSAVLQPPDPRPRHAPRMAWPLRPWSGSTEVIAGSPSPHRGHEAGGAAGGPGRGRSPAGPLCATRKRTPAGGLR